MIAIDYTGKRVTWHGLVGEIIAVHPDGRLLFLSSDLQLAWVSASELGE